jgi:hypothetical protein
LLSPAFRYRSTFDDGELEEVFVVIPRVKHLSLAAAGVVCWTIGIAFPGAHGQTPRVPPSDLTRPADTKPFTGDASKLLEIGTKRHGDTRLSSAGRSCNTCHSEADSYNATFKKPWPHFVASVRSKTGLDRITAEGMVQFCMISAMGVRPLPWDSETLAALTAFVIERHSKVVEK